jgi:hypothetical protein
MKEVYRLFLSFKEHANWSFLELYNLPVALRSWFIDEFVEQKAREQEARENTKS